MDGAGSGSFGVSDRAGAKAASRRIRRWRARGYGAGSRLGAGGARGRATGRDGNGLRRRCGRTGTGTAGSVVGPVRSAGGKRRPPAVRRRRDLPPGRDEFDPFNASVEVFAVKSGVFYEQQMKAGQLSTLATMNDTSIGPVIADAAGNPVFNHDGSRGGSGAVVPDPGQRHRRPADTADQQQPVMHSMDHGPCRHLAIFPFSTGRCRVVRPHEHCDFHLSPGSNNHLHVKGWDLPGLRSRSMTGGSCASSGAWQATRRARPSNSRFRITRRGGSDCTPVPARTPCWSCEGRPRAIAVCLICSLRPGISHLASAGSKPFNRYGRG